MHRKIIFYGNQLGINSIIYDRKEYELLWMRATYIYTYTALR